MKLDTQAFRVIRRIAIIVTLFGVLFYLLVLSPSFGRTPTHGIISKISCGSFSLQFVEILGINRLEGSSATYSLWYSDSSRSEKIPISSRAFDDESSSGYIKDAHLLTTTPFTTTLFRSLEGIDVPSHLLLIDPSSFSSSDFDQISSCLQQHQKDLTAAYADYVSKTLTRDHELNLVVAGEHEIMPGLVPRGMYFLGTAYIAESDLQKYLESKR